MSHCVSLLCVLGVGVAAAPAPMTHQGAMMYLAQYGYMEDAVHTADKGVGEVTDDVVTSAVRRFQTFVKINVTGVVDSSTMRMMQAPRCGVRDMSGHGYGVLTSRRRRRYVLHYAPLRKKNVTYAVSRYPKTPEMAVVDGCLRRAFDMWSKHVDVTFTSTNVVDEADLDVSFVSGDHGDDDPFDGPGYELAHASYPRRRYPSYVHFDEDEMWTGDEVVDELSMNLYVAALHEFGHSLGLRHSDDVDAVMFPVLFDEDSRRNLHVDDIMGVQALYGKRFGMAAEVSTPSTVTVGPLCDDPRVDDVVVGENGTMYLFKGSLAYVLHSTSPTPSPPAVSLSNLWPGIPSHVDAATWASDGSLYVFKGRHVWLHRGGSVTDGFPKLVGHVIPGLHGRVDSVMEWSVNGWMYIFKGKEMWAYHPGKGSKGPLDLNLWKGAPQNMDAAFDFNGRAHFLKGLYCYSTDDVTFQVLATTLTAHTLLGCPYNNTDSLTAGAARQWTSVIVVTMTALLLTTE